MANSFCTHADKLLSDACYLKKKCLLLFCSNRIFFLHGEAAYSNTLNSDIVDLTGLLVDTLNQIKEKQNGAHFDPQNPFMDNEAFST